MSSARYSPPILIKLESLDSFSKNTQILTFIRIRPVGS
jgi:hypothetical protein